MSLLRRELGVALRRRRVDQHRTLRAVAADAGVSLGYLSEVERGVKEASSELLAAICGALGAGLPEILVEVADALYLAEAGRAAVPAGFVPASLVPAAPPLAVVSAPAPAVAVVTASVAASVAA
jgi:transcriptional regulator with XRE-family HTH domain